MRNPPPPSFGRPAPAEKPQQPAAGVALSPFTAEMVIVPVVDEDALRACGEQIASMVASAVRQGMSAGVAVAGEDLAADGDSFAAGTADLGDAVQRQDQADDDLPPLTPTQMRLLHGDQQ